MEYIEAIILGIVQGATEFLPISSSGHLILVPSVLGLTEPDINAIAFAHQGTLLAVLAYFRKDLWLILTAVIDGLQKRSPMSSENSRLGWYIAIGTIPAVIAGFVLAKPIDEQLANPAIASFMLMVTGIILILAERFDGVHKSFAKMDWLDAIIIGFIQTFALIPGISRSGVTIGAGLMRGLDRYSAAKYSFLLGIPAITGAGVIAIYDLLGSASFSDQLLPLIITLVVSFIVGYLCIHFLLTWLRGHTLNMFAVYCLLVGFSFLAISQV